MKLSRILTLKMSGEDVSFIQTKLKDFGFFTDKVSGYFSQNTLIAVTNFQRAVGIKDNGEVGSLTWNKILHYNDVVVENISEEIMEPSYVTLNGLTIFDHLIPNSDYYQEVTKKDTIFLHNTHGGSRPDWSIGGWKKDFVKDKSGSPVLQNGKLQPLKVGKSYVIGRKSSSTGDLTWDGKIIRAFDDKYWAHHLQQNNSNLNSTSIAIEICNYGPLTVGKDGRFYNLINKPIDEKEVVKLDTPFKGYEYFERYTQAQLDNLHKLLIHLINKHAIQIQGKIYNKKWFEYNNAWNKPGGIRSHSQIKLDSCDIFPQKEMIDLLNSL